VIPRHLAALSRTDASRPARLSVADGLVLPGTTVLDYGCGKGADVRWLHGVGADAVGWDPHYRPDGERRPSDVVLLAHVVNVIEDPSERADTLKRAWDLAGAVLVVAARLESEARASGNAHEDGFITKLGTFQKLYDQGALKTWLEGTLGVPAVPAGPGVFYIFRDEARRQGFIASRFRGRAPVIRVRRSDELYAAHKELLQPLLAFLSERGRPPLDGELPGADGIRAALGSVKAGVRLLCAVVGEEAWAEIEEARIQDILVYLALSRFSRRPKFSDLPPAIQGDVRAFFTSYQAACELADAMLMSAGDMTQADRACRSPKIGKETPAALYAHVEAVPCLPPLLRIYEGCARAYIGTVDWANLVKLHRDTPRVSYLAYPSFDNEAHPALARSLVVPLQTFRLEERDWSGSKNPPVLHRKELFVSPNYPRRALFSKLTEQEERKGLYEHPERIGTREGWESTLAAKGLMLKGHRLLRRKVDLGERKEILARRLHTGFAATSLALSQMSTDGGPDHSHGIFGAEGEKTPRYDGIVDCLRGLG
jgi:DNA phosphorothioation-associated putative methyltransferase